MPWVRATLRGKTVLAKAQIDGQLDVHDGRVEVRYNPRDGRLYRASASNVVVLDPQLLEEEFCGPAVAVDASKPKKRGPPGGSAKVAATRAAREAVLQADPGEQPGVRTGVSEAWTDGACSGNPGPAGLGIVLFEDGLRTEISEYLGHATNNIAELTAVLRALELVPPDRPLVVHTDSQYSIGVLQKGWKAKANVELVETIKQRLASHGATRLVYTPGHAGVALNERADSLARMAVSTRSSSRTSRSAVASSERASETER
jgi:ribonuclease HI